MYTSGLGIRIQQVESSPPLTITFNARGESPAQIIRLTTSCTNGVHYTISPSDLVTISKQAIGSQNRLPVGLTLVGKDAGSGTIVVGTGSSQVQVRIVVKTAPY
jgi:hypothetical protein